MTPKHTRSWAALRAARSLAMALLLVAAACQPEPLVGPENAPGTQALPQVAPATSPIAPSQWQSGTLGSTQIVSPTSLHHVQLSLGGPKKWVSNNPEVFRGNGWLMQNSGKPGRGGYAYPTTGQTMAYFFHINKSGSTRYLHVLVSNPKTTNISVQAKGSIYTNSQRPLGGPASGPSFHVANDWLNGSFNVNTPSTSVAPYKMTQVARVTLANGAMADGRLEINTSGNCYIYLVATSSGNFYDAVSLSQSTPAPGDLATAGPNTYGREAGVYNSSIVYGTAEAELPSGPGHIGFCLNTTNKFASYLQEQTATKGMTLNGASPRTYGNYGHEFDVDLRLKNLTNRARTIRVSFASNVTSGGVSFTYNGPVKFAGAKQNVYTTVSNPKQVLATYTLPAWSILTRPVEFYVPGLITTNHQLVVEVLD